MKVTEKNQLTSKDIAVKDWTGEVVVNDDPLKLYRCRIKVYGLFDDLEDDKIPWAHPADKSIFAGGETKGFGCGSVPRIGTKVKVRFDSGNIYSPEYYAIQNVNEALLDTLGDDYMDSQTIVFDEDAQLKVYYTTNDGEDEGGLHIILKDSHVKIDNKNNIYIDNNQSKCRIVMKANGEMTIDTESHIDVTSRQGNITVVAEQGDMKAEAKQGKIDVVAMKDISVESKTGNIDVVATLGDVSIDAKVGKVDVTATQQITLDSKIGVKVTSLGPIVLDSTSSLQVSGLGVTPGIGPFCAIPVCPITGMPHQGSIAGGPLAMPSLLP